MSDVTDEGEDLFGDPMDLDRIAEHGARKVINDKDYILAFRHFGDFVGDKLAQLEASTLSRVFISWQSISGPG